MTPVYQTRFGKDGNCWAACLATIFDLTLDDVDKCSCNNSNWWEETDKFLSERGLYSIEIESYINEKGNRVYPMVWPLKPTICCLLGPRQVNNKINNIDHIVVAKTYADKDGYPVFDLIHDPLGDKSTPLDHIKFIILFGKII